jgi:YD repeat-containing protein
VNTWTFTYDGSGRLATVSRPDPAGGNATHTVAYDVPFSGAGAPVDLSGAQAAGWGQEDLPTYAAAVFPASHVPAASPAAGDWPYAKLSYLDVNGRAVNTATYGADAWQITTSEYDPVGHVIRTLSADNRAQALNPTADTDPTVAALPDSAARARLVDVQTRYDSDNVDVIDSYGPTHPVVLDDGTLASARKHVHNAYDQGAPTGGPFHLIAEKLEYQSVNGAAVGTPRSTKYFYDPKTPGDTSTSGWTLHRATDIRAATGASGVDLNRYTYYNAFGGTVEDRLPKAGASGGDSYTTLTTYYTGSGSGPCVNAAWAGLVCKTGPAMQPSSGPPLQTTTYTYNDLNQRLTAVDTVGSTTRTAATAYDAVGRVTIEAVTVSPAPAGGSALATATTSYDPATGQVATVSTPDGTISTSYDALGRVHTYADADSNTTTTAYTIDGQIATVADGKGTTTFTYNGTDSTGHAERRGLVTALSIGAGTAPGSFSASYDADGTLTSQTYPNGLVATRRYDNASDRPISMSYGKGGVTWLEFTQTESVFSQIRRSTTPAASRIYGYDLAGRFTSVADTLTGSGAAVCTTRRYGLDLNSNRATLTTTPDAGTDPDNGACSTSTPATTVTRSYDEADRLTDSGYSYDDLGRTTALPASDSSGTASTITYYVNDMVASQPGAVSPAHTRLTPPGGSEAGHKAA